MSVVLIERENRKKNDFVNFLLKIPRLYTGQEYKPGRCTNPKINFTYIFLAYKKNSRLIWIKACCLHESG
jgi:hypothetical protein